MALYKLQRECIEPSVRVPWDSGGDDEVITPCPLQEEEVKNKETAEPWSSVNRGLWRLSSVFSANPLPEQM